MTSSYEIMSHIFWLKIEFSFEWGMIWLIWTTYAIWIKGAGPVRPAKKNIDRNHTFHLFFWKFRLFWFRICIESYLLLVKRCTARSIENSWLTRSRTNELNKSNIFNNNKTTPGCGILKNQKLNLIEQVLFFRMRRLSTAVEKRNHAVSRG